jgi:PTS system galactitol-specific IIB component
MNKQKKVLVACGTSIATATVVATKLREIAQEIGVQVTTSQCKAAEIRSRVSTYSPDLIVATTPVPKDLGVPSFSGVPFLSGIGIDKLKQDIIAILKS